MKGLITFENIFSAIIGEGVKRHPESILPTCWVLSIWPIAYPYKMYFLSCIYFTFYADYLTNNEANRDSL